MRPRLVDLRHALVKLTALIGWNVFEREGGRVVSIGHRPPGGAARIGGRAVLYLQHAYWLSDEASGRPARVENPYYQYFTGETFFQHRPPFDPSSLTPLSTKRDLRLPGNGWRNRIGEEGVEWLLTQAINAGLKSGTIDDSSLKRVAVDTTVMEKNISHTTDARL